MDLMDTAEIMNATDAKRQRIGLDRLNEAERVVTLISYARFEIMLGALDGFYGNSTSAQALETVWAYEQIGAPEAADILRRANALFPPDALEKGGDARYPEWHTLLEPITKKLDALRDEFYALDENRLNDLLYQYIAVHRSELPDPE